MQAPIYASSGMTREVGGTITELNKADISADSVVMGLSTAPTVLPTAWVAPTTQQVIGKSKLRVLMLINSTVTAGTYYVWAKITDGPENEPLMFPEPIRVL